MTVITLAGKTFSLADRMTKNEWSWKNPVLGILPTAVKFHSGPKQLCSSLLSSGSHLHLSCCYVCLVKQGLQHKCCHWGHGAHSSKGGRLRSTTLSPDKTFPLASALPSLPPSFPPRTSRSASLRRKHVGVANTSSSHIPACTGLH